MIKNKEKDIEKPVNEFLQSVRVEESGDVQISTDGNFMFVSIVHYDDKKVKRNPRRK